MKRTTGPSGSKDGDWANTIGAAEALAAGTLACLTRDEQDPSSRKAFVNPGSSHLLRLRQHVVE